MELPLTWAYPLLLHHPSHKHDLLGLYQTGSNQLPLWRAQFLPVLHSQRLMGLVDGSISPPPYHLSSPSSFTSSSLPIESSNPRYLAWFRIDQTIQSWIMTTLTRLHSMRSLASARQLQSGNDSNIALPPHFKLISSNLNSSFNMSKRVPPQPHTISTRWSKSLITDRWPWWARLLHLRWFGLWVWAVSHDGDISNKSDHYWWAPQRAP